MPRVHLTTASMMLMIDLRLADLDRQIAEKVEALRGPNPDEQDLQRPPHADRGTRRRPRHADDARAPPVRNRRVADAKGQ